MGSLLPDTEAEPSLEVQKHIKYWQRCLKSLLPTDYTSTDSSRMALGFFILSALDLLGAGADSLPLSQQTSIKEWILTCQHPSGGFVGSPNHVYPERYYSARDRSPANLPLTFFAILSLSFVDGLGGLKKKECMAWLRGVQRPDGSFGELIAEGGQIKGGNDMRYCYCAAAIRWVLRVGEPADETDEDIDVEKLVNYIRASQVYLLNTGVF
jgi:geranylgeranyl transferase type-1 subunit beta